MSMTVGPRTLFAAAGLLALGTVARANDARVKPQDATRSAEIGAHNRKAMDTPPGRTAKQTGPAGSAPEARDSGKNPNVHYGFCCGSRF